MRCVAKDGSITDLTYAGLASQTSRFANLLRSLGVGKGERVFTLLGRVPELYVAALGTLKNSSVLAPLFSAFGPEPIRERLRLGDAKALVTSPGLYLRKIAPIRDSLPGLEHVLIVGEPPDDTTLTLDGGTATSPLTIGGKITGVDESLRAEVHQLGSSSPVGSYCCQPAGGQATPWSPTVPFHAASGQVITIVVHTGGHVAAMERFAVTGVRVG